MNQPARALKKQSHHKPVGSSCVRKSWLVPRSLQIANVLWKKNGILVSGDPEALGGLTDIILLTTSSCHCFSKDSKCQLIEMFDHMTP